MTIKIVTDSTSDLPETLIAQHDITVVPAHINIGDHSYLDGIELSREEFYENLPHYDPLPQTSTPGLGAFIRTYEQLADDGATQILSIHISAKLSGMMNVAHSAAQTTEAVPITVFDSRQLSLGTGFLVLTAARAAQEGYSMQEIVGLLEQQTQRTYSFALLDTLEFLRRGGRLSRFQSGVGALLRIKPLLIVNNGEMTMQRVRTRTRARERLIGLVSDLIPLEQLALIHAHAPDAVEELRQQVQHLVPKGTQDGLITAEVTPAIGTHVGPGAVGLVCVKSPQGAEVHRRKERVS